MAKKKEIFSVDEFGFDKELEFDDVDFDIAPPKDDRKPVTKAAAGVIKGARDTAFSNQFVKKVIKKTLPKGYGDAMEMVDEGMQEASKLYNTTAKEIKPTIKELRKTAHRAIPHLEGKIPKSLAEKLKKWTDVQDESNSVDDYRESSIAAQLGEIFQEQMKEADKQKQKEEVTDAIKENVNQTRHNDIFQQLDGIRINTTRLVSYQDKVNAGYQRKSLELQYRQYFVMADLYEEQKKANEQTKASFAEIVKNTGLPEYVKLQNSERLGEMMRNKFMSNIYDTIFDKRKGYAGKFVNRLGSRVRDKITGFMGDVKTGIDSANMVMDMADTSKDMGIPGLDPYELGGSVAGGLLMDEYGTRAGVKLGNWINKSKYGKKVRAIGSDLEYGVKNISQLGDKFSRGDFDYSGGIGGKLIGAIQKLPGGESILDALKEAAYTGRPDQSFKIDSIGDMQGPAIFTNQTRKSITEVIPGFLSRIYQELQIIRTGDSSIGLTEYDYNSNKFAGAHAVFKNALSKIADKDQTQRHKETNNRLIDQFDPQQKLSEEERTELGKFFLSDNFKNGLGDPKRFTNPSEFKGVDRELAKKAAALFGQSFGIGEFGDITDKEAFSAKRVKFSNSYSNLGYGINDSRNTIQQLLNLGHHDLVRQAGLIDERGQLNMDQLYGLIASGQMPSFTEHSPSGAVRPFVSAPNSRVVQPMPVADQQANNGFSFSQEKADEHHDQSMDVQKQILEAIKSINSVEFDRSTSETAQRIEKLLLEGQIGSKARVTGGGPEKRRWYQASIGDLIGSIASGVSSGISYAGTQVEKAGKGLVGLGKGILGFGWDKAKQAGDWLTRKRDEVIDLYIKGEAIPRIQAWRLKAGHYYDQASGKVIKKLSDIKGAIVDKDGNIILSLEDLKNIVPPDMRTNLRRIVDGIITTGKKGIKFATGFHAAAFDAMKSALRIGKGLVMKALAKDVYVIGEDTPRLLAITMRAGGYRSKLTGKVIWRPLSIDGPVLNSDGEVVLTDADLRKGIVDVQGKPFRSIISRLASAAKSAVTSTFKMIKHGARQVVDKAKGAAEIMADFIANGVGIGHSKTVVERLTEIRDLLRDRLPERKKKVFGDTDGDGDREGSWQDMDQKREANKKSSGIGGAASTLGAVRDKAKTKKEENEEEEDDDDGLDISDIHDGWDMVKGGWKRVKRWGKKGLSKGKGLLKKIPGARLAGKIGLKGAGKLLGVAGAGYGAYSAIDNLSKGNYGEATLDAGLTAGGLAMTGGIGSAMLGGAGTLGSGLAAIGAGALGLLSAPVVIGALALGAGYLAYKYLSKEKLDTLSTYRFAQYGFTVKDTDALQKVFGLENRLMGSITYDKSGAKIKDDIPVKELLDLFGITQSDSTMVSRWVEWFQGRFKPVFLTHLTALRGIAPQVSLADVDKKLKVEEKKKYFDAIRFPNGPYNVYYSPIKEIDTLKVSPFDVEAAARVCEDALKKEQQTSKEPKSGISEAKAGAVTSAMSMVSDVDGANTNAQAAVSGTGSDKTQQVTSQDSFKTTFINALNNSTGIGSETGLGYVMQPEVINSEKQISPLNAIRYRTYGLYAMELPKINNLLTLEQAVIEKCSFNKDGVSWDGEVADIITRVGGKFGVIDYNTREGENFSKWFNSRFLPVFQSYANTVYSLTGKKNLREATKMLSPSQLLAVANAIYTTRTSYNGRSGLPVWSVTASPWADYVINTNEATVHESVKALSAGAKNETVNEKVPVKKANELTAPSLDSDKSKDQAQKNVSLWDKTKDTFNRAKDWAADKISNAYNTVKNAASGVADTISSAASAAKNYVTDKAKSAYGAMMVATGLDGTGGAIDQVPMPKGDGSWSALKDTIISAAKMVGVDPKLMAVMAAIESGFKSAVKAGTSTAAGLYQFITGTWNSITSKFGGKYGISPNTDRTDPRASALMGAEFLKNNIDAIRPALNGRQPSYTDLYLAHFLGPAGAKKFLSADPNTPAAQLLPDAAGANKSIFFDNGRARTVGEVYTYFTNMIGQKAKSFNIDIVQNDFKNIPAANDPIMKSVGSDSGATAAPGVIGKEANKTALSTASTTPAAPASLPTSSKTAEMIAADSNAGIQKVAMKNNTPAVPAVASPVQGGFNQASRQNIADQVQATQGDFSKSMGSIDQTLTQSLEVQRASYAVLQAIRDLLEASGGPNKMPNVAKTESKAKPIPAAAPAEMPKPAISMRRTA